MPRAPLLPDDEIASRLDDLAGWERDGPALQRSYRFADFTDAVAFVRRLVDPANALDHHPDVSIHWNEVTLRLWTHASGGITERDFRLARAIDEVADAEA